MLGEVALEGVFGVGEAVGLAVNGGEEHGAALAVGIDFDEVLGGGDHLIDEAVGDGVEDDGAELFGLIPGVLELLRDDIFEPFFAAEDDLAAEGVVGKELAFAWLGGSGAFRGRGRVAGGRGCGGLGSGLAGGGHGGLVGLGWGGSLLGKQLFKETHGLRGVIDGVWRNCPLGPVNLLPRALAFFCALEMRRGGQVSGQKP